MPNNNDKWDQRYLDGSNTIPEPALVLKENSHLLPSQGKALDLACGRGGNAIFLAKRGLSVTAWDFSTVAIGILAQLTATQSLDIYSEVKNIVLQPPEPGSFDVIVVSYFLDRSITQSLIHALLPQGLLFYQTFTRNKVSNNGPTSLDYLLKDNELLELFAGLDVRVYREEGLCGNIKKGLRNEALFVGQKMNG